MIALIVAILMVGTGVYNLINGNQVEGLLYLIMTMQVAILGGIFKVEKGTNLLVRGMQLFMENSVVEKIEEEAFNAKKAEIDNSSDS